MRFHKIPAERESGAGIDNVHAHGEPSHPTKLQASPKFTQIRYDVSG